VTIKGGAKRQSTKFWADKGYDRQLESFIARVRSGQQPEITVVDGARATIGCVGMLESARTLQPFRMDTLAMIQQADRTTAQSVL
jgi:hypothetical protein